MVELNITQENTVDVISKMCVFCTNFLSTFNITSEITLEQVSIILISLVHGALFTHTCVYQNSNLELIVELRVI